MAGIEWMFTLVDQASGPARTMTRNVRALEKATRDADRAALKTQAGVRDAMDRVGRKSQEGVSSLNRIFTSFGGGKVFGALADSARSAASGIMGAFRGVGTAFRRIFNLPTAIVGGFAAWGGKLILDAIGWRESTLAGLDILLGGQKQAEAAMKVIQDLSKRTTLPMQIVSQSMQDFLRTGKADVGDAEKIITALADVFAVKGFRPEVFEAGAEGIRRMLGSVSVQAREVKPLMRALGLSQTIFEQQLAKVAKVAPSQIKDMLAKGQIAGKDGAQALVNTIIQQINRGKPLGTAFDAQMETLPGIFRALRTSIQDFFATLEIKKMPGLDPLKRFIKNIREIIENPQVKKAAEKAISGIFGMIFGPLDKLTTPAGLEKFFNELPQKVDDFLTKLKRFFKGIEDAFGTMKRIWKDIEPTVTAITKTLGKAGKDIDKSGIAGSLAAFAGPLIVLSPIITPLAKSLGAILGVVGKLIPLLGPAAPFVIGLAAVATGFKLAYDNIPQFREAVDNAADGLRGFLKWSTEFEKSSATWITGLLNWNTAFEKSSAEWLRGTEEWVAGTQKWARDGLAFLDKWAIDSAQAVKNMAIRLFDEAKQAGANLINGLIEGITGLWKSATDAIGNVATGIVDKVKGIFKPGSPSRVFMAIGESVTEGLIKGIESGTNLVQQAMRDIMPDIPVLRVHPQVSEGVTEELVKGIEGGIDRVQAAIRGIMPDIPALRVRPQPASVVAAAAVPQNGARRAPAEINLTVNVDGGQAPQETADAVSASVTEALAKWFDLIAQEGGGVPVPVP